MRDLLKSVKAQKKRLAVVGAVLIVVTVVLFLYQRQNITEERRFRTEKVVRGDIQATVTATGKVDAVTTVIVGTQISGMIKELYVDYNSPVKKNQLLARIDPALYEGQLQQAKANFLATKANLEKAEATLADATRTMERYEALSAKNFIARSELDTAKTAVETSRAQVSVAEAQVKQAEAALKVAEINLHYTQIRSPVDGMVISRNVDVGQTVAASFQTPTLFSIAKDLTDMQIITSVDEADIGKVHKGQNVFFTVDAYPEHTFAGRVHEIRNAPVTIQNVVTYEVIVRVDNRDLRLKPGMTANVSIVTDRKVGVLKVPNASLRFRPPEKDSSKPVPKADKTPGIWILVDGEPKRMAVKTGISDGTYTEITAGDIKEGDIVIIEAAGKKKDQQQQAPRFIR